MAYGEDNKGHKCWHRKDDSRLFIVENTSGKRSYVVASSFLCARWIALWARHIREVDNGQVFSVKREWLEADLPFQSALRRAVKAGSPGLITRVGDAATILESRPHGIEGCVYTPMSSA